jgi:hypothetical protein
MSSSTIEVSPAIEAMIARVKEQPIADWGIFTTGKPATVQGKKADGTYRTVPYEGTEEFAFCDLRMGKRGKMIFAFRPIDPMYEQIELDEEKVFIAVPAFEAFIAKAIDASCDPAIFDGEGNAYRFARSKYIKAFGVAAKNLAQRAEDEKKQAAENRAIEDPRWGSF